MSSIPSELPPEFGHAFDAVGARLGPLGSTILFFTTIGSTNDVALRLAAGGDRLGAIVIAEQQTAGRGRRGRTWFSPPGSGLYVSIVLAPGRAAVDRTRASTLVTLAVGVALAEAIEASTGLRAAIKWPNDLYVGRRKLAGILAEAVAPDDDSVVVGYGINVCRSAYPPELADRATSIETELGRSVDRAALCAESVAAVSTRYANLLEGRFDAILDAWRERAPASRGARVAWHSPAGPQHGITAGIDDRGALLVKVGERVERIVGGEVVWE